MFADDIIIFLSKFDRLNMVQKTLDHWCKALGAKFNIKKTEIVPIGSKAYRMTVTTT